LVALARRLNGPGGCAWDRAQSTRSLLPHLIEEVWEAFAAARDAQSRAFEDELGDVLYTAVFLALVGQRERRVRLRRMLTGTYRKLYRRHPHVFEAESASTPAAAYQSWQTRKRQEGKRPSASKRLRPMLVEIFERLERSPEFERRLRRWLARQRRVRSTGRTSDTQAPSQGRSSSRGRHQRGVG
jgi:XTP/dITP diphosphohydrolase